MDIETPQWLMSGQGIRPELQWTFRADAPLVDLQLSRESGETVLGDEAGGVYRLNRQGRAATISRGFHGLRLVATDDVGRHSAIVSGDSQLSFLNRALSSEWAIDLPDAITALAVSPYGRHLAVGLANGKSVIYDARHQRVCHIETDRPLQFLHFQSGRPAVIGAAEYGQLLEFDFSGRVLWSTNLHANIGGITGTGDGKRLSVATFTQGVKHLDENGQPAGRLPAGRNPAGCRGQFPSASTGDCDNRGASVLVGPER